MKKDKKAGDRRGTNPNSLTNLRPAQFGDVRNPSGINGRRPFTQAIQEVSLEPLPELVRLAMNAQFRSQLRVVLKRIRKDDIPDLYEAGITWARANAQRLTWSAVFVGNVGAAIEIREAVEGKAPTRVEFVSRNDKLEELLDCFRRAARAAKDKNEAEEKKPN